jgi:phospholipid/cholesterol/gamma-HCH transport system substrate-binding protein
MTSMRTAAIGAFVVGGLLLFSVGLFFIGDRRLLFSDRFELHTTFGRVSGLQVGTEVRVAGLSAGEILDVEVPTRPSDPFRIRMRMREDVRMLVRQDSVAGVQTDGIMGSAFIQVAPGSDASPMVESGDTIRGEDPIEFADLIAEGRDTFRVITEQITMLTADMSETIDTLTGVAHTVDGVVTEVGADLTVITAHTAELVEDARRVLADARELSANIRAGRGNIGRLLNDDGLYERWTAIAADAERAVANLRESTDHARAAIADLTADDGAVPAIAESLRGTIVDAREVISDLSEGTEALKRNFLFRGFFQDRGYYDLDALSPDAYSAGALERSDRTALRVWIDAGVLFSRADDGSVELTSDGRRRLDSVMSDFLRYPRDSPLVVEGYAGEDADDLGYLLSADRAAVVRQYLLDRFRRSPTITGVMPMGASAEDSPSDDDRWSGVALTLFVPNDALSRTP